MALTYSIENSRVHVVSNGGELTIDDVQSTFSNVRAECVDSETLEILIIDRESEFDPSDDQVREIAKFWGRLFHDVPTRIALIVAKDVHYGIGRMVEVYARPTDFRFRVFRDEVEGRAWLYTGGDGDV